VFDQRGELPLLPFGNPIGFVPASRGGVYIDLFTSYGMAADLQEKSARGASLAEKREKA